MHDTIDVIFQPKWADSVRLVEVLAFVTLFRSIGNPIGSLVLAKGRADLEFKWNVLVVVCQLAAVWAGARLGQAVGVALGLLVIEAIFFVLCYGLLIRPLVGSCLPGYLRNLAAPVLPALAMGAALVALPNGFAGLPRAVFLVLEILFGATIYAGLLWAFQRDFLREGLAMFRPH
jgi:O-antigen/teichoic acid export membrane protein